MDKENLNPGFGSCKGANEIKNKIQNVRVCSSKKSLVKNEGY